MARYDMTYFCKLPLKLGVKLINKAFNEKEKDKAWLLWSSIYPHFTEENFVPFSKFWEENKIVVKKTRKTSKQILDEAAEIEAKIKSGMMREAKI